MQASIHRRPRWALIVALVAIVFGALTVVSGGRVLFGSEAARLAAGDYVPLVVWFNFLAGFAYVAAGVGLWRYRPWSAWLALAITVATALMFAVFGAQVAAGGAFEARTVAAMIFRIAIWAGIAALAWRGLVSRQPEPV